MGGEEEIEAAVEERSIILTPKKSPWLIIPYEEEGTTKQAFCDILCETNSTCMIKKSIPELTAKSYYQKPSHQGWLIIMCDDAKYDYSTENHNFGDCYLWNPTTLKTIHLPNLSKEYVDDSGYYFVDCVLSSPPPSDADVDDNKSMVFFVYSETDEGNSELVFLYCLPGKDKEWRRHYWYSHVIPMQAMESLHYFKDKFYLMCSGDQSIKIYTLWDKDKCTLGIRHFYIGIMGTYPTAAGFHTSLASFHFVATSDQLYSIQLCFSSKGLGKDVIQVAVLSLDFQTMDWKMVYDVGDHVLFLGSSNVPAANSACCSAAEMGLDRGCLYFTLPEDQCLYKFDIQSTGISVVWARSEMPKPCKGLEFITVVPPYNAQRGKTVVSKHGHKRKSANLTFSTPTTIRRGPRSSSPCLMFNRDHRSTTFSFINPVHNKETDLSGSPDLENTVIRFQRGGWLLLTRNNRSGLFFYNPFTRETINLPELPVEYTLSTTSFSSLPTLPDCVVFGIEQDMDCQVHVYYIRKGEASWSSHHFANPDTQKYMPSHNAPVFYNGIIYYVDYNGSLGVFKIEDTDGISGGVLEKPDKPFDAVYPSFLVESEGDLLLVKLGRLGSLVGIFRLEDSDWVEIEDLGNRMLFVSNTSCFSAIAPNSAMQNKVYFPRICMNGEGVLFYCLKTGSYRSTGSHSASDFTDTEGWYLNCTWIQPNLSKSTMQELEWVKSPPMDSYLPWIEPTWSTPYKEE